MYMAELPQKRTAFTGFIKRFLLSSTNIVYIILPFPKTVKGGTKKIPPQKEKIRLVTGGSHPRACNKTEAGKTMFSLR